MRSEGERSVEIGGRELIACDGRHFLKELEYL